MSYNPERFCRGMESGIMGLGMAVASSMAAEREIDRTGPLAIAQLAGALRSERRLSAALAKELTLALERLREAEAELAMRPRGRR